jgi:Cupin
MSADALSDVLRTVRLTGATFFDIVAKAPWVAEQPPREKILPKILPGAGHLIIKGSRVRSRRAHQLNQRLNATTSQGGSRKGSNIGSNRAHLWGK